MRAERPHCAHTRCSYLSKVTQNAQTHVNTYTPVQMDELSATHRHTHPHLHEPSGVSRFISDCSLLSFQPNSPLPLSHLCVCLSSCLSLFVHGLFHSQILLRPLWADGVSNIQRILASNQIPYWGTTLGAFIKKYFSFCLFWCSIQWIPHQVYFWIRFNVALLFLKTVW